MVAATPDAAERIFTAPQWQLVWWRFARHRVAVAGGIVILALYIVALGADFFACSDPYASASRRSLIPPQPIHFAADGHSLLGGLTWPYVHPLKGARDPVTFEIKYVADPARRLPLSLFAHGFRYNFLGLSPTDLHLLGVGGGQAEDNLFLLGTDLQGRDEFSRLMFATRTSMTIGLVGVSVSLLLGVTIGGISGYYGRGMDAAIQRVVEIIRSIPTIPLWLGLAAALPNNWSVTRVYFAITLIISLIGWTELSRVVRGRFLALAREDFVVAAELSGCRPPRIIFRHLVPAILSHVIAATTLALPTMIISETSLSFLGLGLRPPAMSWGVLLQDAQNIESVALSPWLLSPAALVIIVVLAFNFLGDGLRDAADPYG